MANLLMMNPLNRLKHAWNAFRNKDPTDYSRQDLGQSSGHKPDRLRMHFGTGKSIVTAVYNQISLDVASTAIRHVRMDENDRYVETIDSELNNVLTLSANLDQTARSFVQDVVLSMFDEGCVAIVPVDTSVNPNITASFDIHSLRVGRISEWFPKHVRVRLYDERDGLHHDILVRKKYTAIIENPLYSVMNEKQSALSRLLEKLNILDAIDKQSSSGKLDIIVQVPYSLKTPARRLEASERRSDIENQLSGSKYGIAYIDGTEKVIQLNRAAENNLMAQVEYLTSMLYSQLGLTSTIFDGTADEKTMLNYYSRTVEPILAAIVEEFRRKFITKTGRTQGQSIMFFRDPFKLIPANEIANMADKFTRNEILSSNEFRAIIGFKPSNDPRADELRNKNLNAANDELSGLPPGEQEVQNDVTDSGGRSK